VHEIDIHRALLALEKAKKRDEQTHVIRCTSCAAQFDLDTHMHAGQCPYCSTPVVTSTGYAKTIRPKALLPFAIDSNEARKAYKKWMSGLWFAPSALKKYAKEEQTLNGVYIPYWTYDSGTITAYKGLRGDTYYVSQSYTAVVNGRHVRRTRQVPKIRWTRVSGRTQRHFDDVLVGASRSLPRKIMDWLQPWDLENLIPYTEAYLSGFSSEIYQVELDEGFNRAKQIMEATIRNDAARSIGGDHQQVQSLRTEHSNTTFKHVLLPLWSAGFKFRGKTYRFVVNGRNGKLRGERPWSLIKITLAVLAVALIAAVVIGVAGSNGGFEMRGRGYY
jgi:DNA-directed RNA polymerase subunit RPC12/RpoP